MQTSISRSTIVQTGAAAGGPKQSPGPPSAGYDNRPADDPCACMSRGKGQCNRASRGAAARLRSCGPCHCLTPVTHRCSLFDSDRVPARAVREGSSVTGEARDCASLFIPDTQSSSVLHCSHMQVHYCLSDGGSDLLNASTVPASVAQKGLFRLRKSIDGGPPHPDDDMHSPGDPRHLQLLSTLEASFCCQYASPSRCM